jgi:hypothetical protein
MTKRQCFVIAPIGEDGSAIRIRSDQILKHIVRPVAAEFNFEVTRADEIAKPGIITTQVIERLIQDPLVIADLTGKNPNVYYELAVRHASRNPVIQLLDFTEDLPFDIAGTRTIRIDHRDLDSVENAKKQLGEYIRNVMDAPPGAADSPISLTIDLKTLRESHDPQQASLADIAERMTEVHGAIVSMQRELESKSQRDLESKLSNRLDEILTLVSEKDRHNVSGSDAVSNLSESIEKLRSRLLTAVRGMIDKVKEEHTLLASKIKSVFDEQAQTACGAVSANFSEIVKNAVESPEVKARVLSELIQTFMHGMKQMGEFEKINITNETIASTEKIESGIKASIEAVFQGINEVEKKIIALPNFKSDAAE